LTVAGFSHANSDAVGGRFLSPTPCGTQPQRGFTGTNPFAPHGSIAAA
jgi:hypothetical protein